MRVAADRTRTDAQSVPVTRQGERPPDLLIRGGASPRVAPPAELVALQRLIADRPSGQRSGGPGSPVEAHVQLRGPGSTTAAGPIGRDDARSGGSGVGGSGELTALVAETREQALAAAQSKLKQAFGVDPHQDAKLPPTLAPEQEKNITYQSDQDFEDGYPRTPEETARGLKPKGGRGAYAYALDGTPLIRVRESLTDDPHLTLILSHELLHTLVRWSDPPVDLDEGATQLLALFAQDPRRPLSESIIDDGLVYVTETNNLNDLLARIAGEQRVPLLAAAFLRNDSAQLDAKINARLSPGEDIGRYIFLAGFNQSWPNDIGGRAVPTRNKQLAHEDPIATVFGLLDGTRRLVKNPRKNVFSIRRSVPLASR